MTRRTILRRVRLAAGITVSLTALVALALGLGASAVLDIARRAEEVQR